MQSESKLRELKAYRSNMSLTVNLSAHMRLTLYFGLCKLETGVQIEMWCIAYPTPAFRIIRTPFPCTHSIAIDLAIQ